MLSGALTVGVPIACLGSDADTKRSFSGSTSLAENEKKHSQVRRRPRLEATELDLELARY